MRKSFYYICLLAIAAFTSCGKGLAPEEAGETGIAGTITFEGTWPPNTGEVRIVVFYSFPPDDLADLAAFSEPVPVGAESHNYSIILEPGTYEAVIAGWRSTTEFWDFDNILGFFNSDSNAVSPGHITVKDGELLTGIDIIADFNNLLQY